MRTLSTVTQIVSSRRQSLETDSRLSTAQPTLPESSPPRQHGSQTKGFAGKSSFKMSRNSLQFLISDFVIIGDALEFYGTGMYTDMF